MTVQEEQEDMSEDPLFLLTREDILSNFPHELCGRAASTRVTEPRT